MMTDTEWLAECARHYAETQADSGGAPLAWLARGAAKAREAIHEFGEAAWDEAYAKAVQNLDRKL